MRPDEEGAISGDIAGDTFPVTLTVNGHRHAVAVPPWRVLVEVLRDDLGLTGTRVGCETTSCGACTVLLDGRTVKSCTVLAVHADGAGVITVEGLAGPDGELHPVQEAFRRHHALQCGFCTPGMVLAAVGLIAEGRAGDEGSVRAALRGNICRCTGYQHIVDAVRSAAG